MGLREQLSELIDWLGWMPTSRKLCFVIGQSLTNLTKSPNFFISARNHFEVYGWVFPDCLHSLCFKLFRCVFLFVGRIPRFQKILEVTARGLEYGYDYWGNFGLALYTMFQVFTQEPPGPEILT